MLESVDGGTVFLDEVGELPMRVQAKLLRFLELGEVQRIGSLRPRRVDVRVIAATNRDLEAAVAAQTFRGDLFFRLNGFSVTIPPLRDRPADVRPLAETFLRQAAARAGAPVAALSPAAVSALEAYGWPGNARELRFVVERARSLCRGGAVIEEAHLMLRAMTGKAATPRDAPAATLRTAVDDFEKQRIVEALARTSGNQKEAAKLLGVTRRTLINKIEAYRLPRPRKRPS